MPSKSDKSPKGGASPAPSRARRWARRLLKLCAAGVVLMLGLWLAIHEIPWLGPALADGVRAVVGPEPVAWAENIAYGVQDRINQWRYKDAKPVTFWEAPTNVVPLAPPVASGGAAAEPPFTVKPFGAPFSNVAAEGDGVWIPVEDLGHEGQPPGMFKAQVHPDPRRGFAVLAVVAIDASAYDLHLMAGTAEPESSRVPFKERPGKVPDEQHDRLVAAFNGGFKATHGSYGMMVDDKVFLPPRDIACTFVRYRAGVFAIGTWSKLSHNLDKMHYYRQTPPCLVEDGEVHSLLHYSEYARGWGATVSGETVIRRSAIGLDVDRKVIFYGLGDAMTAQATARGMAAAGAHWVAELDVNYSFPRFLFYQRPAADQAPVAVRAIIPSVKFDKNIYVRQPSVRDFFYLTRRESKEATAPAGVGPSADGKLAER